MENPAITHKISDGLTDIQALNISRLANGAPHRSVDLNAIQRMAIFRSQKILQRLEKAVHRNEIDFFDHTIKRFQTDVQSKDAIQSLASKFSIITSLQQALSS